ncbi:hypothetical protein EJ03DRAFT_265375 [Teratosphaeria nubilosa]|uniref:Uncharacterized protein n=1 Tax=Teratosphaeria nubilosa TaxID=161662 RepID=A0A6G1LJP6_9PEZI|nr:hypothetical protein EJ03DRAFT_265375 [Teratosphaeria nubilosa]
MADAPEAPVLPRVPPASRLPAPLRFVLVTTLSFAISSLLYTLVRGLSSFELAAISRPVTDDYSVFFLVGWKLVEIAAAWIAGYDWYDLAGLSLLSNLPYHSLIFTFYNIDASAVLISLAIDVISLAVPFALLRPNIHAHEPGKQLNQQVAQDWQITSLTVLFGSAIYAVTLYFSLYSWLPSYLITHSVNTDKLSMERAHAAKLEYLVPLLLPVGWATAQFLFKPAIGSRANPGLTDPTLKPEKVKFDSETATIWETLAFNLGFGEDGFSPRAEILAKRTSVLIACTVVNTFVRVLMTVDGTEPVGTMGWSSIWGVAAFLASTGYAFIANE